MKRLGIKRLGIKRTGIKRTGVKRPRITWRWKPVEERNPVAVALVGLVTLSLIGVLAYNAGSLPLIGGGTTYTADFKESAGLNPGDEVRVAGVAVGEVDEVALDGARVKVTFTVEDTWVGNRSTAAIGIKTLLGSKYLALDPLGTAEQDPDKRIPLKRTMSPYDVVDSLNQLGETVGEIDGGKLAESFEAVNGAFGNTGPEVRTAVEGLSDLSRTINTRDAELAKLLKGSNKVTRTLSKQNGRFEKLLTSGNSLLSEVRKRRDAIHTLFTGSRDLGTELSGLVADNNKQLAPTLAALERVTGVLKRNHRHLNEALASVGPYYRLVGNTLGNGRWLDGYLCGLVPDHYLPEGTPPQAGCMPPEQGGDR